MILRAPATIFLASTLVAGELLPPFIWPFFFFQPASFLFCLIVRYLIVLYYQPNKMNKKVNVTKKEEELQKMKDKYGLQEDK